MSSSDTFDPTVYEADLRPEADENAAVTTEGLKVATIRTSDRLLFKRCRRRWGWNSHLRGNLAPKTNAAPLWTGSGFHFALEDCHSQNLYGHPGLAFLAYREATLRQVNRDRRRLPGDLEEQTALAVGMLCYYWDEWLNGREKLQTFVHKGIPQVEVNFRIEVPWEQGKYGIDKVIYSGTLDRVVIDENGLLWIVEYKTAKIVQTLHFSNDAQVGVYLWAGNLLYGQPIAGVIYQQHRKAIPSEPRILASGRLSQDKSQMITHRSLRKSILNIYGTVERAPRDYVDMLNYLASQEDMNSDKFVRRDKIQRNAHQGEAEGVKILLEMEDMLNPDLPLYPNPTRDCQFMCPFNGVCTSLDAGEDWEYEMGILMQPREGVYDSWRQPTLLPSPEEVITNEALQKELERYACQLPS